MVRHKLNDFEISQINLLYALGYRKSEIVESLKIGSETFQKYLKKRKKNLDDYFETGIKTYFGIQNNDLKLNRRKLEQILISPFIQECLNLSGLDKKFEVKDNLEILLETIFGSSDSGVKNSVYNLFVDYLRRRYEANEEINLTRDDLINEFSDELRSRLNKGYFDLRNSLKDKVYEYMLKNLTVTQFVVLNTIFKFNQDVSSSLDDFVGEPCLTNLNLESIEQEALKKLRDPKVKDILEYLYGYSSEEIKEKLKDPREVNFNDLKISVHTYNFLKYHNIKKLGELNECNELYLRAKGFTIRSLIEIKKILEKNNLGFQAIRLNENPIKQYKSLIGFYLSLIDGKQDELWEQIIKRGEIMYRNVKSLGKQDHILF